MAEIRHLENRHDVIFSCRKTFSIFTLGVIYPQNLTSKLGQTGTSLRAGYRKRDALHRDTVYSKGRAWCKHRAAKIGYSICQSYGQMKKGPVFWLAVFYGYTEIDMRVLFTLDGNDKGLRGHSKKICKPRFNTDINPVVSRVPKFVQTRCICLPCAALSWGQPTWQGLGFGGLVHEETHPCASNLIQSIFLFWVHQQCPGPDCSICQWLDLRKNIS